MGLEVKKFICGPLMTNAYIVFDGETKEGFILDPAPGCTHKVLGFIQENAIKTKFILLTHSHWDHIADCRALKDKLDLKVYVHKEDRQNLEIPGSDRLFNLVNIQPTEPEGELYDGQKLTIGGLELSIIHTPGHSPGSVCLYFKKEKTLFSGDTLFKGGYGTLDVATAEKERMFKSLARLKTLEEDTLVYCGHGPTTTIGNEPWLSEY